MSPPRRWAISRRSVTCGLSARPPPGASRRLLPEKCRKPLTHGALSGENANAPSRHAKSGETRAAADEFRTPAGGNPAGVFHWCGNTPEPVAWSPLSRQDELTPIRRGCRETPMLRASGHDAGGAHAQAIDCCGKAPGAPRQRRRSISSAGLPLGRGRQVSAERLPARRHAAKNHLAGPAV